MQIAVTDVGRGPVRVWRLADVTRVVPPLDLPAPVRALAVHGNVVINAAAAAIAVHQPALPQRTRQLLSCFSEQRPADGATG